MALWADKHRPKCFDDLSLHKDVSNRLRQIAARRDLPHLLLHGPAGGGKRTRVAALLRAIYGADSGQVIHTSTQTKMCCIVSDVIFFRPFARCKSCPNN